MIKNEKIIVEEICKFCTLKEKIIIKLNKKVAVKVYRIGLAKCFNFFNK